MAHPGERVAVLVSGGLDSAVLVGDLARQVCEVFPLYVRCGLAWEALELEWLHRFLAALASSSPLSSGGEGPGVRGSRVQQLTILEMPVRDIYGAHWSLTGEGVPDERSPDEAVFLPGRNLLLLLKAMLWCHRHVVPTLALGILKANPFPDATPEFFHSFEAAVNQGIGGNVCIVRPYAAMAKSDVIRRGAGLPLHLTLSCMRPSNEKHCGRCNKCAERQQAFRAAGVVDPTTYDS